MRDRWGVVAVLTAWLVVKFIAMPLAASRSDHISDHPGAWTYLITAALVYGLYKGWHGAWVLAVLMEGFFLALFLLAVAPGPIDAGEATMMILQAATLALLGWPSLRAHVRTAANLSTARL